MTLSKLEQAHQQRRNELLPEGKLQWQYADTRRAPVVLSEPPAPSVHATNRLAELQRKYGMKTLQVEGFAKLQENRKRDVKFCAVATTYREKSVKLYFTIGR